MPDVANSLRNEHGANLQREHTRYRRAVAVESIYFFTVNLVERRSDLLVRHNR
ncbi:MAG: hypothetical protein DID91_2727704115 [Candidatus Nitrotoga sp. MKT]|nr:MAG: hypothetical protein DID91_2727704115 [Candidatus Nitrotoga sp. MKT]